MKRPVKEDYRPFDLTGDTAIAKWMIDYSIALEKYIETLEKVLYVHPLKIIEPLLNNSPNDLNLTPEYHQGWDDAIIEALKIIKKDESQQNTI